MNAPELQDIRNLSSDVLPHVYSTMIPEDRRSVSDAFWDEYSKEEKAIGYRACLLLWVLTKSMKIPREFQIRATIATLMNKDSLLDVGTNAGKTLCIVLPCLVSPDTLAVVFSPLKRLQAVQVLTFEEYGIKAIAINEDTPNNSDLWKVCLSPNISHLI
jgi:superfamily II DNA helicase RecQ